MTNYFRATTDKLDDCYGEWKHTEKEAIASFYECNTFSDEELRQVRPTVYCQRKEVSEGKQTDGPWDSTTGYSHGTAVPLLRDQPVIAIMAQDGDVAYVANVLDSQKTQQANARLLAAAPDLLDACGAALECIEAIMRGDHFDGDQMVSDLKKAIYKAEGGVR